MAYTPNVWKCGDIVTADKLNHMEEGIANAGGSGDVGYSCTEESVTLTDESVITTQQGNYSAGRLSYSGSITADTISVTFNGVEYTCQRMANDGDYGASYNSDTQSFNWSEYPFNLYDGAVSTENAGTYQIKIETVEETIETSECFNKAVKSVSDRGYECIENYIEISYEQTIDNDNNASINLYEGYCIEESKYSALRVEVNGVTYDAPWDSNNSYYAFDLGYIYTSYCGQIHFNESGTYTFTVYAPEFVVNTSDCFNLAVENVPAFQEVKNQVSGINIYNILDGSSSGSVRTISSLGDDSSYTIGKNAFAEGYLSKASGENSHAESFSTASGKDAHAESGSTASGKRSHAESDSTASGDHSHAESGSTASGDYSHAESGSTASGERSHAEGYYSEASGENSHAQNLYTTAQGYAQTVIGKFNVAQGTQDRAATTDYALIIGNGRGMNNRSNALAIKWDGTFVFANGTEISPTQFASLLALLNA